MITYKGLFDKLHSLENLRLAFKKASKGKTKKWYVREFEANLENELMKLKTELETEVYKPKRLKRFVIRDPKTRVIYASDFRDRVVHHAICNLIEPIFEKVFIYDNYANRKKKGVHAALKRFDKFERKVTTNGKLVGTGADISKIATMANSEDDSWRMLHFTSEVYGKGGKIIGICMGENGILTRELGPFWVAI